ncbi:gamma-glutamylcyclotransferase [Novosphingobium sp. G106]|uniref:gamma-glutamylcyclotransferase family protein n=1 Tax=Novosphingobium sp. G106 TaxID=2849500 RepID=UPI001C2D0CF8|nr:gamma-glutamylcyclotransferase family protein [Novosphingobium sp. G106]MBV1689839.1 gamma-glutamylcyclotransferase [Novosphingobium sp. G106]
MHFFFYGTLIAGSGNPVAAAAHALLRDLGTVTARGALYAVSDAEGWYPVLLSGAGPVHGRLYEAAPGFGESDLAALDAYEDFDPADPGGSLYVRSTIVVSDGDGAFHQAQAYSFNRPLPPGAQAIPDGDFRAWIAREGLKPYGTAS